MAHLYRALKVNTLSLDADDEYLLSGLASQFICVDR